MSTTYWWVPDDTEVYVCATSNGITLPNGCNQYVLINSKKLVARLKEHVFPCYEYETSQCLSMEDLSFLPSINAASILHTTRVRFQNKKIYSSMGTILLSVNPFIHINGLYGANVMESYINPNADVLPSHLYLIPSRAYSSFCINKRSQALIISGESGSGKTEAAKECLNFLTYVSRSNVDSVLSENFVDIPTRIIQASRILESFGNAATSRNPNSSRFGKYIEINFDNSNKIFSSTITSYLLEKSRVTKQLLNERNYHIFYQLLYGLSNNELLKWHINSDTSYRYLSHGVLSSNVKFKDNENFTELVKSFEDCGFETATIFNIFKIAASILLLGNLEFIPNDNDSCSVSTADSTLKWTSELLSVPHDLLRESLCSRSIESGVTKIVISIQLNATKASNSRDNLARSIFERLFAYIISKINENSVPRDHNGREIDQSSISHCIGLLDIFGFEILSENSFEQLCINYCNEMLQSHFNFVVFIAEQQLYKDECVNCSSIEFKDNGLIIGEIELMFKALDDEGKLPKGSSRSWYEKLKKTAKPSTASNNSSTSCVSYIQKRETFVIAHYAAKVEYTCDDLMEKNVETVNNELIATMTNSTDSILTKLFGKQKNLSPHDDVSEVKSLDSTSISMKSRARKQSISSQISNRTLSFSNNPSEVEVSNLNCNANLENMTSDTMTIETQSTNNPMSLDEIDINYERSPNSESSLSPEFNNDSIKVSSTNTSSSEVKRRSARFSRRIDTSGDNSKSESLNINDILMKRKSARLSKVTATDTLDNTTVNSSGIATNHRLSVRSSAVNTAPKSVSWTFKSQLYELLKLLKSTENHFIRCIKSNPLNQPLLFDNKLVNNQLTYSGVYEVIKIQQSGLPFRISHHQFIDRYKCLIQPSSLRKALEHSIHETFSYLVSISEDLPDTISTQIGKTMIFSKNDEIKIWDDLKSSLLTFSSTLIQKHVRRYLCQKIYQEIMKCIKNFDYGVESYNLEYSTEQYESIIILCEVFHKVYVCNQELIQKMNNKPFYRSNSISNHKSRERSLTGSASDTLIYLDDSSPSALRQLSLKHHITGSHGYFLPLDHVISRTRVQFRKLQQQVAIINEIEYHYNTATTGMNVLTYPNDKQSLLIGDAQIGSNLSHNFNWEVDSKSLVNVCSDDRQETYATGTTETYNADCTIVLQNIDPEIVYNSLLTLQKLLISAKELDLHSHPLIVNADAINQRFSLAMDICNSMSGCNENRFDFSREISTINQYLQKFSMAELQQGLLDIEEFKGVIPIALETFDDVNRYVVEVENEVQQIYEPLLQAFRQSLLYYDKNKGTLQFIHQTNCSEIPSLADLVESYQFYRINDTYDNASQNTDENANLSRFLCQDTNQLYHDCLFMVRICNDYMNEDNFRLQSFIRQINPKTDEFRGQLTLFDSWSQIHILYYQLKDELPLGMIQCLYDKNQQTTTVKVSKLKEYLTDLSQLSIYDGNAMVVLSASELPFNLQILVRVTMNVVELREAYINDTWKEFIDFTDKLRSEDNILGYYLSEDIEGIIPKSYFIELRNCDWQINCQKVLNNVKSYLKTNYMSKIQLSDERKNWIILIQDQDSISNLIQQAKILIRSKQLENVSENNFDGFQIITTQKDSLCPELDVLLPILYDLTEIRHSLYVYDEVLLSKQLDMFSLNYRQNLLEQLNLYSTINNEITACRILQRKLKYEEILDCSLKLIDYNDMDIYNMLNAIKKSNLDNVNKIRKSSIRNSFSIRSEIILSNSPNINSDIDQLYKIGRTSVRNSFSELEDIAHVSSKIRKSSSKKYDSKFIEDKLESLQSNTYYKFENDDNHCRVILDCHLLSDAVESLESVLTLMDKLLIEYEQFAKQLVDSNSSKCVENSASKRTHKSSVVMHLFGQDEEVANSDTIVDKTFEPELDKDKFKNALSQLFGANNSRNKPSNKLPLPAVTVEPNNSLKPADLVVDNRLKQVPIFNSDLDFKYQCAKKLLVGRRSLLLDKNDEKIAWHQFITDINTISKFPGLDYVNNELTMIINELYLRWMYKEYKIILNMTFFAYNEQKFCYDLFSSSVKSAFLQFEGINRIISTEIKSIPQSLQNLKLFTTVILDVYQFFENNQFFEVNKAICYVETQLMDVIDIHKFNHVLVDLNAVKSECEAKMDLNKLIIELGTLQCWCHGLVHIKEKLRYNSDINSMTTISDEMVNYNKESNNLGLLEILNQNIASIDSMLSDIDLTALMILKVKFETIYNPRYLSYIRMLTSLLSILSKLKDHNFYDISVNSILELLQDYKDHSIPTIKIESILQYIRMKQFFKSIIHVIESFDVLFDEVLNYSESLQAKHFSNDIQSQKIIKDNILNKSLSTMNTHNHSGNKFTNQPIKKLIVDNSNFKRINIIKPMSFELDIDEKIPVRLFDSVMDGRREVTQLYKDLMISNHEIEWITNVSFLYCDLLDSLTCYHETSNSNCQYPDVAEHDLWKDLIEKTKLIEIALESMTMDKFLDLNHVTMDSNTKEYFINFLRGKINKSYQIALQLKQKQDDEVLYALSSYSSQNETTLHKMVNLRKKYIEVDRKNPQGVAAYRRLGYSDEAIMMKSAFNSLTNTVRSPDMNKASFQNIEMSKFYWAYGFDVKLFRLKGYPVSDLVKLGHSCSELYKGGYSITDLKNCGFTAKDLAACGATINQLKLARYHDLDILFSGYEVKALRQAGYDVTLLASQTHQLNIVNDSTKAHNFNPPKKLDLKELLCLGFSIRELKENGYSAHDFYRIGYENIDALLEAGFKEIELSVSGYNPETGSSNGEMKSTSSDNRCGTSDYDIEFGALVLLFQYTNGLNWSNRDNWGNKYVSLHLWYGITTNEFGRVVKIELANNKLHGILPSDVFSCLPYLEVIDLRYNLLFSSIPLSICQSIHLSHIYLHCNAFNGIIPHDIGKLSQLLGNKLSFDSRTFVTFAVSLVLNLSNNQLIGGVPVSIQRLKCIRVFKINSNLINCNNIQKIRDLIPWCRSVHV